VDRRTDRQIDILITILHTLPGRNKNLNHESSVRTAIGLSHVSAEQSKSLCVHDMIQNMPTVPMYSSDSSSFRQSTLFMMLSTE